MQYSKISDKLISEFLKNSYKSKDLDSERSGSLSKVENFYVKQVKRKYKIIIKTFDYLNLEDFP